jgi:hypothetical protein
MVTMVAWSAVEQGFKPWSGKIKNFKIGICCFSAQQAATQILSLMLPAEQIVHR